MSAHGVEEVLHSLIGRMPLEDFNEQVRERRMAHFESAIQPSLLETVFNVTRLERLLHREPRLMSSVDIFDGTHLLQFTEQQRRPGQTNFDFVSESLLRGATIRMRNAEKFDAGLGELTQRIERRFVGRCGGNLYLTPPGKAGFPPHFDMTDVFVVQCSGKKHWRIYDHYTNKSELPLAEGKWEPERFIPTEPPRDFELNRGDVLYLPRGVMHEAFCTDRESMHLTISLASLTIADLIRKAIASAAASDIELRRRVPWIAANEAGETERLAREAKDRLVRLASDTDLSQLLDVLE